MNWYSGSIAEAVALSKTKDAIFVVYIEGDDELSQKLQGFINDDKIKSKLERNEFVAIKIKGGSAEYMQFAQIYQLVPLPSIFFIGKNGTPLEIATGVISSISELDAKIENVLKLALANSVLTSTSAESISTASSEQESDVSSSNVVCGGDVCFQKSQNSEIKEFKEKSETEEPEKPLTRKEVDQCAPEHSSFDEEEEDTDSKLKYAKRLLEEKREEREEEKARLEHEIEIRRRKEGQKMQNFKKLQKDQELHQLKEKIQREKLEEQTARQRILEQIAADRAERAQKIKTATKVQEKTDSIKLQNKNSKSSVDFARIQFRKQNGESETQNFLPTDEFKVVKNFVQNTLLVGTNVKEFSLATTFPRREFTTEDDAKTLQELDLYPSAVLLVLIPTITSGPAAVVARTGGIINVFNTLFWGMLSPVFYIFSYVKNLIAGRRPTNNSGAQKRSNQETIANEVLKKRNIDRLHNNEIDDNPSTSKGISYKRIGGSNIHRLREQKDSDDENNTYNGNSTEQQ